MILNFGIHVKFLSKLVSVQKYFLMITEATYPPLFVRYGGLSKNIHSWVQESKSTQIWASWTDVMDGQQSQHGGRCELKIMKSYQMEDNYFILHCIHETSFENSIHS